MDVLRLPISSFIHLESRYRGGSWQLATISCGITHKWRLRILPPRAFLPLSMSWNRSFIWSSLLVLSLQSLKWYVREAWRIITSPQTSKTTQCSRVLKPMVLVYSGYFSLYDSILSSSFLFHHCHWQRR